MEILTAQTFSFGDFHLDASKRLLLKHGETVPLNSKTFDLLLALLENHGQVLSKDELLEKVWAGQFVEENNLTVHISALRKIFGEKKGEHRFIVTVPGRGYSFVAEIRQSNLEKSSVETSLQKSDSAISEENNFQFTDSRNYENSELLIGRKYEIAELKNLLSSDKCRLVTLTGAGGSGKTRLARTIAGDLSADFTDGVFFVELASINNPELVVSVIANALGLKEAGEKSLVEVLINYLSERRILVVLDNFEQIISAAPILQKLINSTAFLKILVTSRAALHLNIERELIVAPLDVPPLDSFINEEILEKYAAVELFVRRARSVRKNFLLNAENAAVISAICQRLDGLPLAVELAAARIRLLSLQSILDRLENSLNLLSSGAKSLPERQQTMRGAIRWSYDLLDENEKILFRHLSVFSGGFTVEAAESVVLKNDLEIRQNGTTERKSAELQLQNEAAENQIAAFSHLPSSRINVLDLLTSLVDNNLLIIKDRENGDVRLQMLEVVREFALECLQSKGEDELLKKNHAEYFLNFAEEMNPYLNLTESAVRCNRLEDDHVNLRAALGFLAENEIGKAAQMAAAMWLFWYYHNHFTEGRRLLSFILKQIDTDTDISAVVRFRLFRASAGFAQLQGDYEAAQEMYEECIVIARADKHLPHLALALGGLGTTFYSKSDFDAAQGLIEEGLAIHRELNNKTGIAAALNFLGNLFRAKGETPAARPFFEEALQLSRENGNKDAISSDLSNLGKIAVENKDSEAALKYLTEAMKMAEELGNKIMIAHCLDGFAALAAVNENYEQSAKIAGAVESLRKEIGSANEPAEEVFRNNYLTKVRAVFDAEYFNNAYKKGQILDLSEAVALAENSISETYQQDIEIIIETYKFEKIIIEEEIETDANSAIKKML